MKGIIFKYIQILLPQHNCIVLPNFGAFILSQEQHDYDATGILLPPSFFVGFNNKLVHNDGVLASFHSQNRNISYEKALNEINIFISQMKFELSKQGDFNCGSLGNFNIENNILVFKPAKSFVVPFYFGLESIKLKRIKSATPFATSLDLEKANNDVTTENNVNQEVEIKSLLQKNIREAARISFKKHVIPYAVAAAVALVLLIPFGKIQDSDDYQHRAGFINSVSSLSQNLNENNFSTKSFTNNSITLSNNINSSAATSSKDNKLSDKILTNSKEKNEWDSNAPVSNSKNNTKYFLIVASDPKEEIAKNMLSNIKKDGFANVGILESPERFRIHIASFNNKDDADSYLKDLRKSHPKYSTSWIYTKLED